MLDEMCGIQNRFPSGEPGVTSAFQLSDELSLKTGVLISCQSRIQALPRRKAEEVQ
jgi:hypothetical protein